MKKVLLFILLLQIFSVKIEKIQKTETLDKEFTFNYAYDTPGLTPLFPRKGGSFTFNAGKNPLIDYEKFGTTPKGNWRLIPKGTYTGNKKDYPGCFVIDKVVSETAKAYGLKENTLKIYELKDGEKHIAYGVILLLESDFTLFCGDTWTVGGYYLCNVPSSGSVTKKVYEDVISGFKLAENQPSKSAEPSHECDARVDELEKQLNILINLAKKK